MKLKSKHFPIPVETIGMAATEVLKLIIELVRNRVRLRTQVTEMAKADVIQAEQIVELTEQIQSMQSQILILSTKLETLSSGK